MDKSWIENTGETPEMPENAMALCLWFRGSEDYHGLGARTGFYDKMPFKSPEFWIWAFGEYENASDILYYKWVLK